MTDQPQEAAYKVSPKTKPAVCRACHYGHHNECEDDRCDCR